VYKKTESFAIDIKISEPILLPDKNESESVRYFKRSIMTEKKAKCVALFSGGLDSSLAVLTMLEQGVEVTALMFLTHFGCDLEDKSSCSQNPQPIAEKFGFQLKLMHLGEKFIEIVKNPKHGYGKNMNPCIDCRILMLKEAREFMQMIDADFLISGEVLGQRPKSQMRNSLNLIEREAGVEGILLRPLSAKLLEPTIPEQQGLVDREKLLDFNGRSRKPQMKLADKYGLSDYPTPAAGCLLTDHGYSARLKDLLTYKPDICFEDLNLLRVGRHFRLNPEVKMVVGRNQEENDKIESYADSSDTLLEARQTGSPIVLLRGKPDDESVMIAARTTARYCDQKNETKVEITVTRSDRDYKLQVAPFELRQIDKYRL
jgi:tRNA U34 2-thiouridine synthase MnmA/TrmU